MLVDQTEVSVVEAYARQAGAEIRANYIEVESGKRSDRARHGGSSGRGAPILGINRRFR